MGAGKAGWGTGVPDIDRSETTKFPPDPWWRDWFSEDFSWAGLASKTIKEFGPHSTGPHGVDTLQAYWRLDYASDNGRLRTDQEMRKTGELVDGPDCKTYHIAHLPTRNEQGDTAGWKADWAEKDWERLNQVLSARMDAASDLIVPYITETTSERLAKPNFETRALLVGAVIRDTPAPTRPPDRQPSRIWHAVFAGARFLAVADFRRAEFSGGDANFSRATFSGGGAKFCGAQFSGGKADFSKARFLLEDADFSDANFAGGEADFSGASFLRANAVFRYAHFSGGRTSFSSVFFMENTANFTGAHFSGGNASFVYARFWGHYAWFADARFSGGPASFRGAEFSIGHAFFSGAHFSGGDAIFHSTNFAGGEAYFSGVNFSGGRADFSEAIFAGGSARFDHSQFSGGNADFSSAQFSGGGAVFTNAHFSGPAFFVDLAFENSEHREPVNNSQAESRWRDAFLGARFQRGLDWSDSPFYAISAFNGAEIEGHLNYPRLSEKSSKNEFEKKAFRLARQVRTKERNWPRWLKSFVSADKHERRRALEALEGGARTLKRAMKAHHDPHREQLFFRFELRARRAQDGISPLEVVASWLYEITSDYGASIARPFLWIFFLTGISGFVYAFIGSQTATMQAVYGPSLWDQLPDGFGLAIQNLAQPFSVFSSVTLSESGWVKDLHAATSEYSSAPYVQPTLETGLSDSFFQSLRDNVASFFYRLGRVFIGWNGIALLCVAQSFFSIIFLFLFALGVRRKFQIN